MLTFDVAHVRARNVSLVLVPVKSSFARRPPGDRARIAAALDRYAARAGLAGAVVPVWRDEAGGLRFFARPSLHPAVESLTWEEVTAAISHRLTVGAQAINHRSGPRAAAA